MPDPTARKRIGSAGVFFEQLALGLVPLGNLYRGMKDDDAEAVLERWWSLGLRSFDVAPVYGYGLAERRLGRFLQDKERGEFRLSTKVGRLMREGAPPDPAMAPDGVPFFRDTPSGVNPIVDFSRGGIRRSLEESFERLHVDRADIVYIHDPDDHIDQVMSQALPALRDLREERMLGAIGIGVTTIETPLRFVREADIDCVLLAGRYTLLEQKAIEDLFPACEQAGVSVLCGGVMNSGFLADPRIGAPYDYRPTVDQALVGRALKIRGICADFEIPLKAAAIQFPLTHPAVTAVIIGAGSALEAQESVDNFRFEIPPQLWVALAAEHLIDDRVPIQSSKRSR